MDVEFDIESGGNSSEEDASNDLYVNERESKSGFDGSWNGVLNFDGSYNKGEIGVESCSNSSNSGDVVVVDEDNLELLVGSKGQLPHVNGNVANQKIIKLANPRKPSKPPLPPKGPSLDAGDQKFVKELAELALRKRARVKKMKAVRKMKASKSSPSSSYTNLSAMVITVFFFLVIIFHGIRSASSAAVGLIASPETAVAEHEGLISVQYPMNFNTKVEGAPGSHYPVLQDR